MATEQVQDVRGRSETPSPMGAQASAIAPDADSPLSQAQARASKRARTPVASRRSGSARGQEGSREEHRDDNELRKQVKAIKEALEKEKKKTERRERDANTQIN